MIFIPDGGKYHENEKNAQPGAQNGCLRRLPY